MNEQSWQIEQFVQHRPHLRAVAYRMLGSLSEAERIANLGGWLTTVVGRVCLDILRARRLRQEDYVAAGCPSRSSASTPKPIPSRRRCSLTPSGSRCSWCSKR